MHVQSLMLFNMEMFSEHTDEGSTSIKGPADTHVGDCEMGGTGWPLPAP